MTSKESILIVDDDEMILESLVSILGSEGYATDIANTGSEAIAKVEEAYFNAILIDIRLPDMTGIELLTKIQEINPRMKKLILTGYPDTPSAIQAVNQKADAYLVKPFDPEDLLDLIEENLEQQKEELKYTQEKVLDYIKTRVKQLDEVKASSL
ncbi:MAG: response regulator [Candidatus Bathyarchaeota archaeon]|nr:response regulator [Candidatus Bathyarchaeota archaeon]